MFLRLLSADLIRSARGVWNYFRGRRLCQVRDRRNTRKWRDTRKTTEKFSRSPAFSKISAYSSFSLRVPGFPLLAFPGRLLQRLRFGFDRRSDYLRLLWPRGFDPLFADGR